MANDDALGQSHAEEFDGDSMRQSRCAVDSYLAVSRPTHGADPRPTLVWSALIDLGPEPLFQRCASHAWLAAHDSTTMQPTSAQKTSSAPMIPSRTMAVGRMSGCSRCPHIRQNGVHRSHGSYLWPFIGSAPLRRATGPR